MSIQSKDLDRDCCFVKAAIMARGEVATLSQIKLFLHVGDSTAWKYIDRCIELNIIEAIKPNTFRVKQ